MWVCAARARVCVCVCVCVCQCLHAWPVCGSFSVMSVSLCVSQSVCDSVYMSVVSIRCELWLSQSALISRSARACVSRVSTAEEPVCQSPTE